MPRERVLLQHLLELGPVPLEPYFGSLVLNDKTNRVLPKILHHLIYRKNKNRFRNENGQTNCFLSIGPVGGGPVEISGSFAAETVCQQHTRGREIENWGLSRCGARSRGIGASEKRICANGLARHRVQPTGPMHGLTAAIDEGVYLEILAQ